MSLSAELEQLAWQTLEALSENLQSSIKETQNLASINASLVQLVKFQRSTPEVPKDKDGEQGSLEQKIQAAENALRGALQKTIEMKNQEVVNLRRQLEEQQQNHENEIKQRDERISQLSRQLSENHLMKGQQEVSPRGSPLIHETMNGGYDGKISSIGSEEATTFQTIIDWNCSSSSETVSEALEGPEQPNRTIFVSCLPPDIQYSELESFFGKAGTYRQMNIRQKGETAYAFITFESIKSAEHAKEVLSMQKIRRKQVYVRYAEPVATPWIEIDGLETGTKLSIIKERFATFGIIEKIDFTEGESHALVQYDRISGARFAVMEMNGASVDAGSQLRVSFCCDLANGFIEKSNSEITSLRCSTPPIELENQDKGSEDTSNHDNPLLPKFYKPIPLYRLGDAPQNVSPSKDSIYADYKKKTVYVSNLEPNIKRETLEIVFQKFGTVLDIDIRRRTLNFAYAFVTFQTIAMADSAKAMTGLRIGKRLCKIAEAFTYPQIRVDGFNENTTELILRREFSKFGQISKVSFRGRTTAFVRFLNITSAVKAVKEMDGYLLAGTDRVLAVRMAEF